MATGFILAFLLRFASVHPDLCVFVNQTTSLLPTVGGLVVTILVINPHNGIILAIIQIPLEAYGLTVSAAISRLTNPEHFFGSAVIGPTASIFFWSNVLYRFIPIILHADITFLEVLVHANILTELPASYEPLEISSGVELQTVSDVNRIILNTINSQGNMEGLAMSADAHNTLVLESLTDESEGMNSDDSD